MRRREGGNECVTSTNLTERSVISDTKVLHGRVVKHKKSGK